MFVIKSYFLDIVERGFKPLASDRIGSSLSSGGDSELCLAFKIANYNIYYDERLQFMHFIEKNRLNESYLLRLKKSMSSSRFITRFYLDYLNGYEAKITRFFWLKTSYTA
jgi:hypothetical protein